MVQLASQSTLRSSSRSIARSSALMSADVVILVVLIADADFPKAHAPARKRPATADARSIAERLPGPDETPAVEEHDPVALDRQTHSSAPTRFRQRLHDGPDRLGAGGIIHNVH